MKLTRHNGRTGKNGVYNPKHNDRQFNIDNSDHIDLERAKNHSREKTLNQGIIYSVLLQKKEAEIKVTLSAKKVRSYFPPAYTKEQVEEVIYTLLEQWRKKKGKEEQEDAGDTV